MTENGREPSHSPVAWIGDYAAWRQALAPTSEVFARGVQRWAVLGEDLLREARSLATDTAREAEALAGANWKTAAGAFTARTPAELADLTQSAAVDAFEFGVAQARRHQDAASRMFKTAWQAVTPA